MPLEAVTVTRPAETGDTDKLEPKSIDAAVPTKTPSSVIIILEPEAIIPVN